MTLLFSSVSGAQSSSRARWSAAAAWLLIALGLLFLLRQTASAAHIYSPDFANIFAGAVCLLHGDSPYRFNTVQNALAQHGYLRVTAETWPASLPLYPPFTLALFTPLAGLSYAQAASAFYLLTLALCAVACFRVLIASPALENVAPFWRGLLLCLLMASPETRWALGNGNPIVLVTALLLVCCFDADPRWRWLRVLAFAVAVLLKPQIALPFALPLLVKPGDGWRMVLRAFGVVIAATATALVWCAQRPGTAAWLSDLHANLALGAAAGNTMSLTERAYVFDPRLNLAYLFGYWMSSPRLDALLTTAVLLVCCAALCWAIAHSARRSQAQWALAVGATAALTLLPVYHRSYDALLLVLAVPWTLVAMRTHRQRFVAWPALILIAASTVIWARHLPVRWRGVHGIEQPVSLLGFLTHRTHALMVLALAILLLVALLRNDASRTAENAHQGSPVLSGKAVTFGS